MIAHSTRTNRKTIKATGRCLITFSWIIFVVLSLQSQDSIATKALFIPEPFIPEKVQIFSTLKNKIIIGAKTKKLRDELKIVEHYNLDTVDSMEKLFSKGLPANEKKAKAIAQQRMNKNPDWIEVVKKGFLGILQAKSIGITKAPAIVFTWQGEQFVVYGERNSDVALGIFYRYIKKNNNKLIKKGNISHVTHVF